jgi:cell division protein ZapE
MGLSGNVSPEYSTNNTKDILMQGYLQRIDKGELTLDPDQELVIHELQVVYDYLVKQTPKHRIRKLSTFFNSTSHISTDAPQGLYLWGGVGRGKTHLVDYFYKELPIDKKMRLHFHRFMQIVHEELGAMEGVSDPLKHVAKSFSKKTKIICLDELHVIDITDAMILGKLLQYLFENGVILVTTSNFHPDDLYKNGLQRDRFLPAIELLKKHTNMVEMGGVYDYRSKAFKEIGVYYFISDKNSDELLNKHFIQLSGIQLYNDRKDVIISNRLIPVKKLNVDVVWFDFNELCNTPRSTEDYTQIAIFFKNVLVSDIPVMDASMDDAARRFINMVDTFYDMRVNIVVSAEKEPEYLYKGGKLKFEFKRAVSRINEMQTRHYIKSSNLDNRQSKIA